MMNSNRSSLLQCILGVAVLCVAAGCGATALPAPLTTSALLLQRSSQKVQRDYHMSVEEAEKAVIEAFNELDWEYRYSTNVEELYTIYGRTHRREHVVIDIRPKRNRFEEVKIAVVVRTAGNLDMAIRFHEAISGGGPRVDTLEDGTIVYRTRAE